jgi:hypothetical protein
MRVADRLEVLVLAHPERFPAGLPHPRGRPLEVWINPPKSRATEETRGPSADLDHASLGHLISAHHSDVRRPGCLEAPA